MTLEELLGLPQDGWLAISKMSDQELEIYLQDITKIEPSSLEELSSATPNIGAEDKAKLADKKMKAERKAELIRMSLQDNNDGFGDDNPIKTGLKKKKKGIFKTGRDSKKFKDGEMDDFMKNLL